MEANRPPPTPVMRGLDPRIHVFTMALSRTWMPGSSPGMTVKEGITR